MAEEPVRMEKGSMMEGRRAAVGRADLQLQPGEPRHLHLRAEPEELLVVGGLHPPEVEGIADDEVPLVPTAASQPRTTDQAVHQAAHPPREPPRVPTVASTDALDDRPERLR